MIRPNIPSHHGRGAAGARLGEELLAQYHQEDSEPADAELASDLAEAAEEEDD